MSPIAPPPQVDASKVPPGSDFVLFIQPCTFLLISINLKTYNYDSTTHHYRKGTVWRL